MNNCKTCKYLLFLHKRDIDAYCVKNDWVFKPNLNYETVICGCYDNKKND